MSWLALVPSGVLEAFWARLRGWAQVPPLNPCASALQGDLPQIQCVLGRSRTSAVWAVPASLASQVKSGASSASANAKYVAS